MVQLVMDLFPDQRRAVERRFREDPVFCEICQDYAEIWLVLESYRMLPDGAPEELVAGCHQLLHELTKELVQALDLPHSASTPTAVPLDHRRSWQKGTK